METVLKIEGMMCMHCVAHVKQALEKVPGYSKSANADFRFILENIDNALMQERRINNKISKAANKLTSNIAYLLKKFDNNDFNIEY